MNFNKMPERIAQRFDAEKARKAMVAMNGRWYFALFRPSGDTTPSGMRLPSEKEIRSELIRFLKDFFTTVKTNPTNPRGATHYRDFAVRLGKRSIDLRFVPVRVQYTIPPGSGVPHDELLKRFDFESVAKITQALDLHWNLGWKSAEDLREGARTLLKELAASYMSPTMPAGVSRDFFSAYYDPRMRCAHLRFTAVSCKVPILTLAASSRNPLASSG